MNTGSARRPFFLLGLAALAATAPSACTSSPCEVDANCEGVRICQDHRCVDPPVGAGGGGQGGGDAGPGGGDGGGGPGGGDAGPGGDDAGQGGADAGQGDDASSCPGVGSPCSSHGTCSGGACACDTGYQPLDCGSCAAGYAGYPSCTPAPPPSIAEIAAGGRSTCARKLDGTVWCWGGNDRGGLGLGIPGNVMPFSTSPAPVKDPSGTSTLQGVVALSNGWDHACAVKGDGTVWCWGGNSGGQLGDGSTSDSTLPVQVVGPGGSGLFTGAVGVTCGTYATCAERSDNTAWCWRGTPAQVPVSGVTQAALGASGTTCALTTGASLSCWGDNGFGEIGNGTFGAGEVTSPALVASSVAEVRLGSEHTCVRQTSGGVSCWGANGAGQLGGPSSGTCIASTPCHPSPEPVAGVSGATGLGAGDDFTCALVSGGGVLCWGFGNEGELGHGFFASASAPVVVSGPGGAGALVATQISIGDDGDHACALLADGWVACWGHNAFGQLGDGSQVDRSTPVLVPPF